MNSATSFFRKNVLTCKITPRKHWNTSDNWSIKMTGDASPWRVVWINLIQAKKEWKFINTVESVKKAWVQIEWSISKERRFFPHLNGTDLIKMLKFIEMLKALIADLDNIVSYKVSNCVLALKQSLRNTAGRPCGIQFGLIRIDGVNI